MPDGLVLLDGAARTEVDAHLRGDRVLLDRDDVARATGWERKPEGLCREGVCIPVSDPALDVDGRLDLAALAAALHRPLALDADERVACLGTSAGERARELLGGVAPDFTLPDLDGRSHSLSDHRGSKVLLVVYASW